MTTAVRLAEGRRHDFASRVARRVSQVLRTKTLRPAMPTPLVSFTFDDVPDSAAGAGAAMLEAHGAQGTFYVSGGLMGLTSDIWRFASAADVAGLAARGHEIGCHTFSHPDMQTLRRVSVVAELERNAAVMDLLVPGTRMTNFAYPYGSTALPQKQTVQRRFHSARGTREGINCAPIDLGQLLAVRLYDHLLGPGGIDMLVRAAVARRGWLIFYTHDVAPTPTPHGCTPRLLESALLACRRHACPVVTVEAALDRLGR